MFRTTTDTTAPTHRSGLRAVFAALLAAEATDTTPTPAAAQPRNSCWSWDAGTGAHSALPTAVLAVRPATAVVRKMSFGPEDLAPLPTDNAPRRPDLWDPYAPPA
jgi:hypothetical protein